MNLFLNPAVGAPDPYRWFMLAGLGISITVWLKMARRDSRLLVVYFSTLCGAFIGAKIVYLASEGWLYWNSPFRWIIWATGKTIIGALLGGYVAAEFAKKSLGYMKTTGDMFAGIVPLGVALGRVGCLMHGCCLGAVCAPAWYTLPDKQGIPRWPAVPMEFGFNVLAALIFWNLRRRRILLGQHFHLYLIAYGAFRFLHEWMRDTPRIVFGLSGYQIAAAAVALLGAYRFHQRQSTVAPEEEARALTA